MDITYPPELLPVAGPDDEAEVFVLVDSVLQIVDLKEIAPARETGDCKSGDLAGAPENEIEITPAMIEAGVRELWDSCWFDHASPCDRILIERVFRVMVLASTT